MDRQDIKKLLEEESKIVEANEAEIARRKRLEMDERGQYLSKEEIEERLQDPYGAQRVWKAIHDREMVNHPDHYQGNKFEVIDVIEDYELGFHLGNAVKYILRAGKKDARKQDLKKALWYIQREIDREDV